MTFFKQKKVFFSANFHGLRKDLHCLQCQTVNSNAPAVLHSDPQVQPSGKMTGVLLFGTHFPSQAKTLSLGVWEK